MSPMPGRNSKPVELGKTGLTGWRVKVADAVADPIAGRSPLSSDQVRAVVGAAFFALSVHYVYGTVARALSEARG